MINLMKLISLENEAQEFGFKWDNPEQILEQIASECNEIKAQLCISQSPETDKDLQMEIGDLLHAAFSLAIFCKMDPAKTINNAIEKFDRRFNAVKMLAKEADFVNLQMHSFKELMEFWDKAKKLVG